MGNNSTNIKKKTTIISHLNSLNTKKNDDDMTVYWLETGTKMRRGETG